MTAIDKDPPPAEPPLASGTTLVPPELLAEEYRRIVAAHEADRVAQTRQEWRRNLLTGGLVVSTVALAGAVVFLILKEQLVPVFVTLQGDGSYTTSIVQRDLTTTERAATTKAALWLYVRARLSYSSAAHFEDQKIVYLLSDKRVGDIFQAEVSPKNPKSPWKEYGTRATIRLERISESFPCAYDSCAGREPDAYQVRFRRIAQADGQVTSRQWVATVRFRTVPDIPAWQRVTYNPLGLQVIEFSASEEGAQ
jgi:type IV secretion system protein VirB8